MLSEAVPWPIDEGQEGIRRHRLQEAGRVVEHRLRPQIWSFMYSLKRRTRETLVMHENLVVYVSFL